MKIKSEKIFVIISITCIFCLSYPFFCGLPFIPSIFILHLLAFFSTLCYIHNVKSLKKYLYLIIYFCIIIIHNQLGSVYFKSIKTIFSNFIFVFVCITLVIYILENRNIYFAKFTIIGFILIILISTFKTLQINNIHPNIVRQATGLSYNGDDYLLKYYLAKGIETYGFAHAIPIIIPILIYNIIYNNKIYKLLYLFILICIYLLVYLSGSAGAILMSMVITIITIATRINNEETKTQIIKRFPLIILIILPFFYKNSMLFIVEKTEILTVNNRYIHPKIISLKNILLSNDVTDTDIEKRSNLYNKSLYVFTRNLLIGSIGEVGGHSAILDRFATLGMIGILPLILFGIQFFKELYLYVKDENIKYMPFILGMISALGILLTKSMANNDTWLVLILIMPVFVLYSNNLLIKE